MIRCLVTGRLHDMPQARTSANGNTFAIAFCPGVASRF